MEQKWYLDGTKRKKVESYGIQMDVYEKYKKLNFIDYYLSIALKYQQQIKDNIKGLWPEIKLDILSYILVEYEDVYHYLIDEIEANNPNTLSQLLGGSNDLSTFIDEYSGHKNKIKSISIRMKGSKSTDRFTITGTHIIKEIVEILIQNKEKWNEMAVLEKREHMSIEGKKLLDTTSLMQIKRELANILYKYISDHIPTNKDITKTQIYILGGYCLYLMGMLHTQKKEFLLEGEFLNYLYTNFERALDYPKK
jgi:hypothetical protein